MNAMRQLAATPLPVGFDDGALYLRRWLLDLREQVKANDVEKHRMLRQAIHQHIEREFHESLAAMVEDATNGLYDRLCAIPDEFEADDTDDLPLDLPAPDNE
jgi:hypothetical protein